MSFGIPLRNGASLGAGTATAIANVSAFGIAGLTRAVRTLFTTGEQGVWYDVNDPNLGWRRNKLTWTEQFDNAVWAKQSGVSVTAEQAIAPNGTLSADLLSATAVTTGVYLLTTGTNSTTYTATVYAKAGSVDLLRFGPTIDSEIANVYYLFNLTDGTFTFAQGVMTNVSATMISVGNGWYRCSVTGTTPSSGTTLIGAFIRSQLVGNLYLWGAQLEQASTASTYQRITDGNTADFTALTGTIPTLYQDSTGVTPCSTPGQGVAMPVGLMLDKHKGLELGSDVAQGGDFASATGWTLSGGAGIASEDLSWSAASNPLAQRAQSFTAGKTYKIEFVVSSVSGGTVTVGLRNAVNNAFLANSATVSSPGTYSFYVIPDGTSNNLRFYGGTSGQTAVIDSFSVKELPGNHAFQSTSASRPALSGRYNALRFTEQFDNAAWGKVGTGGSPAVSVSANQATAPDGTLTADKLIAGTSAGTHYIQQTISAYTAATFSIYAKAAEASKVRLALFSSGVVATFDLSAETATGATDASIEPVGDGWYRCSFSAIGASNTLVQIYTGDNNAGNGTDGIYIWGADLRVTNDSLNIPSYQRVVDALTYDTTGFPLFLECDGVDDGMVTNSIDFSASDKMFVSAGVRKLSDAAVGSIVELSSSTSANNGAFVMYNPVAAGYGFTSRGTTGQDAAVTSGYPAPLTDVITSIGDISGDSVVLRLNGVQVASNTSDQGTGTFGNYPLYLFRRGGTTLPFTGRFYNLVVRGGALPSDTQVAQVETYLNLTTRVNVEPQDILLESGDTLALENNDQLSVDQPFAR